ncbi:MAG: hypothetical protein ACK5EK_12205 [Flavobacteriia bacterium]|jgi:hypothetical protein
MMHSKAHHILDAIERQALDLGHQNQGIISRAHGFLPSSEPLLQLPAHYKMWDDLAAATPELMRSLRYRSALDNMPVLDVDPILLPDKYLHRAAILLGFLAHGYARADKDFVPQEDLPKSILMPWATVCERLHRPFPVMTYFDLVAYNWKFKNAASTERTVENMELLFPIFDNTEERMLYLTQTEMLFRSAPIIGLVTEIYDRMLLEEDERISHLLKEITACMNQLTKVSFQKITSSKNSPHRMDPVVFAKTMMSFAVPIKTGIPGPSGAAFPTFHLLDIAFGREKYNSQLGMEALKIRSVFPPAILSYFESLESHTINEYVEKRNNEVLTAALNEFVDAYSGPEGFLANHRKKIYGFLQTAFQVGRSETIGGYSGKGADHTEWRIVHQHLEDARKERKTKGS